MTVGHWFSVKKLLTSETVGGFVVSSTSIAVTAVV